jgi:subtilisin family serine protease
VASTAGIDSDINSDINSDIIDETFSGTQDLIIETVPGGTRALVRQLKAMGVEVTAQYDTVLDGAAVTVTQQQLEEINAALDTVSMTVDAEVTLFTTTTQDAPGWNLDRIDQQNYTPYLGARSYTYPDSAGAGVTVYVLDTGFTRQNDELDGRLGVGADFAFGDHGTPLDPSDDTSTRDCNEHGTHVAGTVASTTYGAAKLATIVPVRVFGCTGGTSGSIIASGIEWVIENRPVNSPAVINMSLGTTGGDWRIDQATQAAVDAGITVVVAAGNGGDDGYGDDACFGSTNSAGYYEDGTSPARIVDAITVGATGYKFSGYSEPVGSHQDLEAYFSNYGTCVDILAPGGAIPSLNFESAETLTISGTSMAAPLVAGVAALYLGENPLASPADVEDALVANAAEGKIQRAEVYWSQSAYSGALPGYPSSRANPTPNLLLNSAFLNSSAGIPNAPSGLTAGVTTGSTVSLTWDAPSELNGGTVSNYVIRYRESPGSDWSTFSHAVKATTGATVTGLSSLTDYDFQVAAMTFQGTGAFSDTASASTLEASLSEPRALSAGVATVSSVSLTWTVPEDLAGQTITDYLVEYRAASAESWTRFSDGVRTSTGATVTGLTAGTSYQFQVAAATGAGVSSFSAPLSVATLTGVTAVPRSLAAGTATASSVPLTWTAPATLNGGTITDYRIQYRVTGATSWVTFAHAAKATTGATVTGLSASRSYQFTVAARTTQGYSASTSAVSKSTLSGITTVPRSLVAGTATTSSMPLTWAAPSTLNGGTITDYKIQYRLTGTTTWKNFVRTAKATTGGTVTGLTRGRSYQFKVSAKTAQGYSVYTAVVSKATRAR